VVADCAGDAEGEEKVEVPGRVPSPPPPPSVRCVGEEGRAVGRGRGVGGLEVFGEEGCFVVGAVWVGVGSARCGGAQRLVRRLVYLVWECAVVRRLAGREGLPSAGLRGKVPELVN